MTTTIDRFLTIQPAIERHALVRFRHLRSVDREEAIAEAVAAGFQSFLSLIRRGKDPSQFPTVIAIRSVQHVRSGRRVGTPQNSADVFCLLAREGCRVDHLRQADPEWADALVDDRQTPIPDQASFRCDFPDWLRTLKPRDRQIADLLALGHSTESTAKRFRLSAARISQLRNELRERWHQFHGEQEEACGQAVPI